MKRVIAVSMTVAALAVSVTAQERRSVLIRTAQPYDGIAAIIEQAGGEVTHRFKHVPGIAADIPESAVRQIEQLVGPDNIGRDDIIPLPSLDDPKGGSLGMEIEADDVVLLDAPGAQGGVPLNYTFNAAYTNVAPLHAAGRIGSDIVIAVIDSGYRPVMVHVAPSRLISPGLNLVPGATEPPAISNLNGDHGTFVSGMAAANIAFCFSALNKFVAVAQFYGAAFVSPSCAPTSRLIPMVGSAPGAKIFPIKVFPAAGGGTPNSRTIQAMEAAIDLRRKFDAGDPAGLNIKVVNLSLGGPTSAAGRTLSDQAIESLINNDIVPVVAAGNDGFSGVTGGSPGTSFAALTVGAASSAEHERIVRSQFFAPCGLASVPLANVIPCAIAYRPDDNLQIATFSSRGPTHDGRVDPDVVANGDWNFSQGTGNTSGNVNFGSGTSFAAPTVSGIAAVLRQAVPSATARQIRNAIIMTANPSRIPTAAPNDQGHGFVDAAAALALLQTGTVPDSYTGAHFTRNLPANMARAGRPVYENGVSLAFTGVRPGAVTDVPFLVPANTSMLHVRVHGVSAELPAAQQNPFFGDDVFMRIQRASVHQRDRFCVPIVPAPAPPAAQCSEAIFIAAGATREFTFERPIAGVWRITPTGDWTNAGRVNYTVDVWVEQESWAQHSAKAKIDFGDSHQYTFDVPVGTARLDARLSWMNMNGHYPISDVDVILTPPTGPVINTCNTGRAPELCGVDNPVAGTWRARVVGFSVPTFGTPGGREDYTLRLALDGTVVTATFVPPPPPPTP